MTRERIKSTFDPKVKVFQTKMPPFGMRKLRTFCELFWMDINELKEDEDYPLLGRIILCMIPKTIQVLKKANPDFPFGKVLRIDPSYNGEKDFSAKAAIQEDEAYIGDNLIFKIQIKCQPDATSYTCRIEIYENRNIVFAGTFKLGVKPE